MARNSFGIELEGIEKLAAKIERLGGEYEKAVTKALEYAGKKISDDTVKAVQKPYLPAKGEYSTGDTEKAIIRNAHVEWEGNVAKIAIGFDDTKRNAGGVLIGGYHRNGSKGNGKASMKPDYALQKIYKGKKNKKYLSDLQNEMAKIIDEAIKETLGG